MSAHSDGRGEVSIGGVADGTDVATVLNEFFAYASIEKNRFSAAHGSLETFGGPQRHAIVSSSESWENGDSEYVIRYAGKIRPFLKISIFL